jgi:hypothetical protein
VIEIFLKFEKYISLLFFFLAVHYIQLKQKEFSPLFLYPSLTTDTFPWTDFWIICYIQSSKDVDTWYRKLRLYKVFLKIKCVHQLTFDLSFLCYLTPELTYGLSIPIPCQVAAKCQRFLERVAISAMWN